MIEAGIEDGGASTDALDDTIETDEHDTTEAGSTAPPDSERETGASDSASDTEADTGGEIHGDTDSDGPGSDDDTSDGTDDTPTTDAVTPTDSDPESDETGETDSPGTDPTQETDEEESDTVEGTDVESTDSEGQTDSEPPRCNALFISGSEDTISVIVGNRTQLTATCIGDTDTWEVTSEVDWSWDPGERAVIGEGPGTAGVLIATYTGSLDITARYGRPDGTYLMSSIQATLTDAVPIRIDILPDIDGPLYVGQKVEFMARCVYPEGAVKGCTGKVTFESADETIIQLDPRAGDPVAGWAYAVGPGTAAIQVSWEGIIVEKMVTVQQPSEIRLSPETRTVSLNSSPLSYSVVCILPGGEEIDCTKDVEWGSTNPEVAAAGEAGVAPRSAGVAEVTASLGSLTSNPSRLTVTSILCDGTIGFPDLVLETLVRRALDKPTGELLAQEVAALKTLPPLKDIGEGIADLTGIESLVNLEELIFPRGRSRIGERPLIYDISPLEALTHLKRVVLSDHLANNVYFLDVSDLANMTALTHRSLAANAITDASPLVGLVNLVSLSIYDNLIPNLDGVVDNSGLGEGDDVHYTNNPLDCGDPDTLADITDLEGRGVILTYSCTY